MDEKMLTIQPNNLVIRSRNKICNFVISQNGCVKFLARAPFLLRTDLPRCIPIHLRHFVTHPSNPANPLSVPLSRNRFQTIVESGLTQFTGLDYVPQGLRALHAFMFGVRRVSVLCVRSCSRRVSVPCMDYVPQGLRALRALLSTMFRRMASAFVPCVRSCSVSLAFNPGPF